MQLKGVVTLSFFQCLFDTDYPKPSRIITDLAYMATQGYLGPPVQYREHNTWAHCPDRADTMITQLNLWYRTGVQKQCSQKRLHTAKA